MEHLTVTPSRHDFGDLHAAIRYLRRARSGALPRP